MTGSRLRRARIGRTLHRREAELVKGSDEQVLLLSRAAGGWRLVKAFVLNTVGTLIFLGALILLYKAVMRPSIAISPISVPKELADKGYAPEVIALQLQRALKKIVHDANSMKQIADVTTPMDVPNIIVPQTGLSLETIAAEIRSFFGIESRWNVSGYLTEEKDRYFLNLRITKEYEFITRSNSGDMKHIDDIVTAAAQNVLEVTDPYLLAASYSQTDPNKAIELARGIIVGYAENGASVTWAHILIAEVMLDRQRKPDEAIVESQIAIERNPALSVPHNNLGKALSMQGKIDMAIVEYKKAIELDPRYSSPHNNLGNALYMQGKVDMAIVEYKKAIELNPRDANYHKNLGNALPYQWKFDMALVELKKATELDPGDASVHADLGDLLSGSRDGGVDKTDLAIVEYKKAIELNPSEASFHRKLGAALDYQHNSTEALKEFKKAHELER